MINTAELGEKRGSTGLTTVSERHAKSFWETPDEGSAEVALQMQICTFH
jgi:hypothetical protein